MQKARVFNKVEDLFLSMNRCIAFRCFQSFIAVSVLQDVSSAERNLSGQLRQTRNPRIHGTLPE